MRKLVFLSLCLFGLSLGALADDQTNAIPGNAPVPVQRFEQAGTATPAAPTPAPVPAPASVATAPATTPASTPTDVPAATAVVSAGTLKDALLQLNKNVLQYQQQNDAKMLILGAQVSTNASEITRLDKALTLLNQEVSAASPGLVKADDLSNWSSHLNVWFAFAGALIILFALLVLLRKMLKKKPKVAVEADDTEGEYDYMGSAESIPAKLNLAHAYIKMENFTGAKEVLQEVIQKGTEEQKSTAKELLKKCN